MQSTLPPSLSRGGRTAGSVNGGISVTDFHRNNLDTAISPYLRQHRGNPVWWQPWSAEVLEYAAKERKPLLISVGYSTCHWCHVMAAEAFSDPDCAADLNADFVAVKVDREERPDIDQFMMSFLVATTGRGGWPLNVFMSADLRPFFAMTYAGLEPRYGMPSFIEILSRVKTFFHEHKDELEPFDITARTPPRTSASPKRNARQSVSGEDAVDEEERKYRTIDAALCARADMENGGTRGAPKFPPHTALLYVLHRISAPDEAGVSAPLADFARRTLDAMAGGGLHDFVGGGFFRYCVDERWTIPHFEKMLYDQALSLWNYSVAARLFSSPSYVAVAERTVGFLERDFLEDGLFCAATDADTEHREGETYLWSLEELENAIGAERAAELAASFDLSVEGNFEGKNHLVTRNGFFAAPSLLRTLSSLLEVRGARTQPFKDRKKLTSWNCLTGIGLLQASRHLGSAKALKLAQTQMDALLSGLYRGGEVSHGSMESRLLGGRFLADHAALLLLLTYHHEERRIFATEIDALAARVRDFRRDGVWMEASAGDFLSVPAEDWDSPFPGSAALAETALCRAAMVRGQNYESIEPSDGAMSDWRSFAAYASSGEWYLVTGSEPLPWNSLPILTVQGEGERIQYCRRGACTLGAPPRE